MKSKGQSLKSKVLGLGSALHVNGVLEYWSIGVLDAPAWALLGLHYPITPSLQLSSFPPLHHPFSP